MLPKTGKQKPAASHCTRIKEEALYLDQSRGYVAIKTIGSGTFGVVFLAQECMTGRLVSVKKVLQDSRYKNRELDILKKLQHPNCIFLENSYVTIEGNPPEHYLHIITRAFPMDLSSYLKVNQCPNISLVKVFAYQLFSGIAYLHSLNICHRDIKTRNLLVDPDTGLLQICDFGSAKLISPNDVSVSYIATRNYRAPELLYDCTMYGQPVDVWACGCVVAEMILGKPLFNGDKNSQMVECIANIIGSPNEKDMADMNGSIKYTGAAKKRKTVKAIFGAKADPGITDLLSKIFVYSPKDRLTARQCVTHFCFNDIRTRPTILPNGYLFVPVANENTNYGMIRAC